MPSISSLSVNLLYEHMQERGHDPEALFGQPCPASNDLSADRTSPEQWQKMLQIAARTTGEDAFGVQVARRMELHHLGLLGFILKSCKTTLEALERAERFHALSSDYNPLQLKIEKGELHLFWPQQHGIAGQLWDEFGVACVVQLARKLANSDLGPSRIEFMSPEPKNKRPYTDFFRSEVLFEQSMPRLVCPLGFMSVPLAGTDSAMLEMLDREAEGLLNRLAPENKKLQRLQRQLLELIHCGKPTLESLAELNNCSERTLQRKLKEAGTTFGVMLNNVRQSLATEYLTDKQLQLTDIADLLGYADQSTFTRAFQTWTGQSPGQWRRQQRP